MEFLRVTPLLSVRVSMVPGGKGTCGPTLYLSRDNQEIASVEPHPDMLNTAKRRTANWGVLSCSIIAVRAWQFQGAEARKEHYGRLVIKSSFAVPWGCVRTCVGIMSISPRLGKQS